MSFQIVLEIFLIFILIKYAKSVNFSQCDSYYTVNRVPGIIVKSQNFPRKYNTNSNCIFHLRAPADSIIELKCFIDLDSVNYSCDSEQFFYSDEGNTNLQGTEKFCTTTFFTRYSMFNEISFGHTSTNSYGRAGRYYCFAKTIPKTCECGWTNTPKIVNGKETGINQYPPLVLLYSKQIQDTYCGGVIISSNWILTAAHCISFNSNATQISAIVGEHNRSTTTETIYTASYDIIQVISHPLYNSTTSKNDIGLLKTKYEIIYNRGVGPVCLPFILKFNSFTGDQVNEAGWGSTSFGGPVSKVLLQVTLDVISNSLCNNTYKNIDDTQVCTYTKDKDSCQRDSGGPLFYSGNRLYTIGCISYGIGCATNNPSVSTRITSYLDWIIQNTGYIYCIK